MNESIDSIPSNSPQAIRNLPVLSLNHRNLSQQQKQRTEFKFNMKNPALVKNVHKYPE